MVIDADNAHTALSTPTTPLFYEVLAYLFNHSEAQDTVEGIVEWWLLAQRITHQRTKVKAALADMVALGLVLERKGPDGRLHYRINTNKAREIQQLLHEQT
jgi:hypothetical protein